MRKRSKGVIMKTLSFSLVASLLIASFNVYSYEFHDLHSGYCCSSANAINNSGQVVGYQAELIGNVSWTNATMWDMNSGNTTQLTALIPNTFNFNRAFDINNRGQIIVDTADGAIFIDGSNRTQLTPLPNQQGSSFTDLELNNIGSILNISNITGTQSLFWSEATNNPAALGTVINGINDSIAMAGEHKFSGITHAA